MPATRSAKEITDSLNVIFFTPTNMMTGAGVENVFAEYILNKPDWVRVKVIQGDFLPGERMDRVIMERLKGMADFETWHIPIEKFDRFSSHFGILRNFVFTMLLKIAWAPRHREEIWERLALPVASVVLSLPALFYFVEGTIITATGISNPSCPCHKQT